MKQDVIDRVIHDIEPNVKITFDERNIGHKILIIKAVAAKKEENDPHHISSTEGLGIGLNYEFFKEMALEGSDDPDEIQLLVSQIEASEENTKEEPRTHYIYCCQSKKEP